ncbi:acyl-CoA dehydrogenase family protein [Nonomuraea sp. NPDC005650]|uniref:acyl-CoA dehydrogenase family protein n=1 Tax=Nonomuraea sp. NPDC005650 TaxID=3157045 RepID=UPI0033A49880
MGTEFYESEHNALREVVRDFVAREVAPHLSSWDERRSIDRAVWTAAGKVGLLGLRTPEQYGGGGTSDYRFRCVVAEELARVGAASLASGLAINEDIVSSYLMALGTAEQKERWLPGMASGEIVTSIAMSEPGMGSDLRAIATTARREGDSWVLNGAKTFITNGFACDVVLVAARTGERDGRPTFSLILLPTDTPGFARGHKLKKLGLHAQDTAELFFDDARVPLGNLVGEEGRGFHHLTDRLPLERLSIGWRGLAAAEAAIEWTLAYTKQRKAFGKRVIDFQNTRFRLAELVTETEVTRGYLEAQVHRYNDGKLDATTAAKVKWWATELQNRVVDACLQLHGGYGYMEEYPISRAFADGRVQTIVGGTTEIMKEIIGRSLAN